MSHRLAGLSPFVLRAEVPDTSEILIDSAILLRAISEKTGVKWVFLPKRDPLLAGAYAVLDRAAKTIWIDQSLDSRSQSVILAHEYGHLVLQPRSSMHSFRSDIDSDDDEIEALSELDGYSRYQYSERCADCWAADFLLPPDLIRAEYLAGKSLVEIAGKVKLPRRYVRSKLLGTLLAEPRKINATATTTELGEHCVRLIGQGTDPSQILIVVPRRLLRERVIEGLSAGLGDLPWYVLPRVATIDSLCFELLQRYGERAALSQAWRVGEDLKLGELVERGLELLDRHPDLIADLQGDCSHLLIESEDEFAVERLEFLNRIRNSKGIESWTNSNSRHSETHVNQSDLCQNGNPEVKDLVCLLGHLCNHEAATRGLFERRLDGLVSNTEICRLRAFVSPGEALREFLSGPDGYLQTDRETSAISRTLSDVDRIEKRISRTAITPEQPGGGIEPGRSLFTQVVDEMLGVADNGDKSGIQQFPDIPTDNINKRRVLSEPAKGEKSVFSADELDLYLQCPKKVFYGRLRPDEQKTATDPNLGTIELTHCVVTGAVLLKSCGSKPQGKFAGWLDRFFGSSNESKTALAPGQALRYNLAAQGIANADFEPSPKSRDLCRSCVYRWVCPK